MEMTVGQNIAAGVFSRRGVSLYAFLWSCSAVPLCSHVTPAAAGMKNGKKYV